MCMCGCGCGYQFMESRYILEMYWMSKKCGCEDVDIVFFLIADVDTTKKFAVADVDADI